MTHDELVQFAAEKVGEAIIIRSVCVQTIGDEDIFESLWFYQEPDGFCDEPFDLTSPDLFFKGLAVFHEQHREEGKWHILVQRDGSLEYNLYISETQFYTVCNIKDAAEIPMKFWESWAEVEGAVKR